MSILSSRRPVSSLLYGLAISALSFIPASPALAASGPASLLQRGQADQALAAIQQTLQAHGDDAQALNLECRVYFSEGRLDQAQPPCEQAVALAPNDGAYHLWLGRVLGRQAEHAPLFSAYGMAKKVRAQFEAAYQLEPHSADAAADLAEFYTDAPGIVGGGVAKAQAVRAQVNSWDPALAHSILAGIAQHEKQAAEAEKQLQLATQSTGAQPSDYVALASFYRKQGQTPQMLTAIDKAVTLDTSHDDVLVSAAEQLTRSGQRPAQAVSLLRTYLASSHQSEEAPAFRVRTQLAELLAASGDNTSAQQQLALAKALASQWQPATGSGS